MPKYLIRAFVGALILAALGGCAGGVNQTQQEIIAKLDGSRVNGVHIPNADCLAKLPIDSFPPVQSVSGGGIEGVWVRRGGERCLVVLVRELNAEKVEILFCADRWKTSRADCERRTAERTGEREYTAKVNWANGWARYEVVPSGNLMLNAFSYPKYGMSGRDRKYRRIPTSYFGGTEPSAS